MLPPAVTRLAEARRHSKLRLAHLVLLLVASRVLANDAGVDPKTDYHHPCRKLRVYGLPAQDNFYATLEN